MVGWLVGLLGKKAEREREKWQTDTAHNNIQTYINVYPHKWKGY